MNAHGSLDVISCFGCFTESGRRKGGTKSFDTFRICLQSVRLGLRRGESLEGGLQSGSNLGSYPQEASAIPLEPPNGVLDVCCNCESCT